MTLRDLLGVARQRLENFASYSRELIVLFLLVKATYNVSSLTSSKPPFLAKVATLRSEFPCSENLVQQVVVSTCYSLWSLRPQIQSLPRVQTSDSKFFQISTITVFANGETNYWRPRRVCIGVSFPYLAPRYKSQDIIRERDIQYLPRPLLPSFSRLDGAILTPEFA